MYDDFLILKAGRHIKRLSFSNKYYTIMSPLKVHLLTLTLHGNANIVLNNGVNIGNTYTNFQELLHLKLYRTLTFVLITTALLRVSLLYAIISVTMEQRLTKCYYRQ